MKLSTTLKPDSFLPINSLSLIHIFNFHDVIGSQYKYKTPIRLQIHHS